MSGQMDIGWTLFAGCLVFFMQAGFSLLEVGYVKKRNTQSILMKNIVDVCVGAIAWFCLGYGLAFGEDSYSKTDGGGVMGTSLFFAGDAKLLPKTAGVITDVLYDDWFFQFTFCATAATIVSGALAERVRLEGYCIFTLLMCLIFYPVVVHWTWGGGFLGKKGYLDFAGSGIVHMFGGVSALVGATILGPRIGRFEEVSSPKEFAPSSMLNITLGTFILWFGWFGFNAGSTVALSGTGAATAARCATTTTIAAAAGGLTAFTIGSFRIKKYDVTAFTNGILGGLVGITAGCSNVQPFIAMIIGLVAGIVMVAASALLIKFKVDDAIGAFPVHGACGAWGVIAAGLFDLDYGWWTGHHFDDALGPNLVGIVCIAAWAIFCCAPLFFGLKVVGLLRVTPEQELEGLDSEFTIQRALSVGHFSARMSDDDAPEEKFVEAEKGVPVAAADAV